MGDNNTISEEIDEKKFETEKTVEETTATAETTVTDLENLDTYIDTDAIYDKAINKKKKNIIAIAIGSVIFAAYLVMTIISIFYFCPGTKLNGKNASLRNVSTMSSLFSNEYAHYNLKLSFRDGEAYIKREEIDLSINVDDEIRRIKKAQNPFLWFLNINKSYEVAFTGTYSKEKLEEKLSDISYLSEKNMTMPEDPVIYVEDGQAKVKEGNSGNYIKTDILNEKLNTSLTKLMPELNLEEQDCYYKSEVALDDPKIIYAIERYNGFLLSNITYLYGEDSYTISEDDIYSMISIDKDYNVSLSKDLVRNYLTEFSKEYDTVDTDRKFKTHLGNIVRVNGSKYGWKIDIDKETDQLFSDIVNHRSVSREPEFLMKGYVYNNGDDIGNTYAEVDLTNQHMYFYKDGVCVFDSDFVSGCKNKGNNTPGGLYCLNAKARNATLVGRNYATPVSYWLPFNRGIGFHDANWRSSFGGDIYITNGSHGCINLPPYKAGELYGLIKTGTPVVCYWR